MASSQAEKAALIFPDGVDGAAARQDKIGEVATYMPGATEATVCGQNLIYDSKSGRYLCEDGAWRSPADVNW